MQEKPKKSKKSEKAKGGWSEVFKTFLWAITLAMIFRLFLFQPFHIPSGSMKPTLLVRDFIIVSQYAYGYSKHSFPFVSVPLFDGRVLYSPPKRGDIVVFKVPERRIGEDVFVKRVIGLPGDKIQMKEGVLYINDTAVVLQDDGFFYDVSEAEDIKQQMETLPNGVEHYVLDANEFGLFDDTDEFHVPEGHFFMMGDNRDNSNDSRDQIGFVPAENLIGRAEIILISSEGAFWNPINWRFERFFKKL